ncbi:hypothetical protein LDENG_00285090, partial [Lucifuga dentata]
ALKLRRLPGQADAAFVRTQNREVVTWSYIIYDQLKNHGIHENVLFVHLDQKKLHFNIYDLFIFSKELQHFHLIYSVFIHVTLLTIISQSILLER